MKKRTIFAIVIVFSFIFSSFAFEYREGGFKIVVATTIPVETDLTYGKTLRASDLWIKMIRNAKKSIDFSEFYLTGLDKEPLKSVIREITFAAKRGVKVRFLVELKMLKNSRKLIDYFSKFSNIKITFFNWETLTHGINHSKYFIVDNRLCYIGSQNFDWRSLRHIHETGIMTNEPHIVKALGAIYNADWNYNNGDKNAYSKLKKMDFDFLSNFYLVASPFDYIPKGVEPSLKALIKLFNSAKSEITIQVLNYSTYVYRSKEKFDTISNALKKAAKRGVKVKVLVSDWNLSKPKVYSIKELAKFKNIEVRFVHIPESREGFIPYARVIHSKVVTIDGKKAWVGTSNFGYHYFYKSRNVGLIIKIKDVVTVLRGMFGMLWTSKYSHVLDINKNYKAPKVS